jgi:hypothetical protein
MFKMFNKKEKIELTDEQKEQAKFEKEARSIKRKEKAIRFVKDTGLVAAGIAVGAGGTLAYQKFSGNKNENVTDNFENEELSDDIGNVFAEDRSEEVA